MGRPTANNHRERKRQGCHMTAFLQGIDQHLPHFFFHSYIFLLMCVSEKENSKRQKERGKQCERKYQAVRVSSAPPIGAICSNLWPRMTASNIIQAVFAFGRHGSRHMLAVLSNIWSTQHELPSITKPLGANSSPKYSILHLILHNARYL